MEEFGISLQLPVTPGPLKFTPEYWQKRMRTEEPIPLTTARHLDHLCNNGNLHLKSHLKMNKTNTNRNRKVKLVNNDYSEFLKYRHLTCFCCSSLPPSRDTFFYSNTCKHHPVVCWDCKHSTNFSKFMCKFCKVWKKEKVKAVVKTFVKAQELSILHAVKVHDIKILHDGQTTNTSLDEKTFVEDIEVLEDITKKYCALLKVISGSASRDEIKQLKRQVPLDELYVKSIRTLKFGCQWCVRVFASVSLQKKHIQKVHNSSVDTAQIKGRVKCPVKNCNFVVAYESQLRNHINSRRCAGYRKLSQFKCEKCCKWFSRSYNVRRHRKLCRGVETGLMPSN